MPNAASVQVNTRGGVQSVPLAALGDGSFVGVVPVGATSLVGPDEDTRAIEPGSIPFEDAILAPRDKLVRDASFPREMRKSYYI